MDSTPKEVLLKLYELGAQETYQYETTVLVQLVTLPLTAVGFVVWFIVKGSAKESDIIKRLSGAPIAAFLIGALFLWTLNLGKNEVHIVYHNWKNRGIEQRLLGSDLANKVGNESGMILPANEVSSFNGLACGLLLPSIYKAGHCHVEASDILGKVVLGDLLWAVLIYWLMGASLRKIRGTKWRLLFRVAISVVAFSSSFVVHVILIRY